MAGRAQIATKSSALIAMIADEVWLMKYFVLLSSLQDSQLPVYKYLELHLVFFFSYSIIGEGGNWTLFSIKEIDQCQLSYKALG